MCKRSWLPIVVVILIAGCYLLWQKPFDRAGEPVLRVGAALPLTGPGASLGSILNAGLQWKIGELKSEGHAIEYFPEDIQSDSKQAVTVFNQLTNIQGIKIIFTITSSASMTLKPFAERDKVLLWADAAHPQLTEGSSYVLRHAQLSDQDAGLIADHIIKRQLKSVGVFYQQDDWGVAVNEHLAKLLKAAGVDVTAEVVDHKSSDFRTVITKAKNHNPQAFVFAVFGPALGVLIQQSKELRYDGAIYSAIGWELTPDARTIAGNYAKGMYYTAYLENAEFDKAYRAKFGIEPPVLGHIGYTDIELLWQAVQATGSTEPGKIIAYIKGLGHFKGKYEEVKITSQGDMIVPLEVRQW